MRVVLYQHGCSHLHCRKVTIRNICLGDIDRIVSDPLSIVNRIILSKLVPFVILCYDWEAGLTEGSLKGSASLSPSFDY